MNLSKNHRTRKKSGQFQLLIFGDSITKNISPSAIVNCDEMQAANCSTDGSKVEGITSNSELLRRRFGVDVGNKICILMIHTNEEFPNTSIYFLAILPKFGRSFNGMINYVNNEVFNLC